MSDLCDSLEDDACENISLDSLENIKTTNPINNKNNDENFSFRLEKPFRLHDKITESNKNNLFPIFVECIVNGSSETSVSTENKKNSNDEDELLIKKGLKRNVDGSFSKSPHQDVDDLPFVSKEFKNLNLQKDKRKSSVQKKSSGRKLDQLPKKISFSFVENSKDFENMLRIIDRRLEKTSSEEVLTSRGSCSRGETDISHYKIEDNLTDSMKEELIRTLGEDTRKTKKKFLSRGKKASKSNEEVMIKERSKIFTKTNHLRINEDIINRENSARKHKSDIVLPNIIKPRLSYLERYQKENGFEPLCIRQWNKETPQDSNRSNYGDSAAENLSEISSVVRREEEDDEDEEAFYMRWIQREKQLQNQKSKICLPCIKIPNSDVFSLRDSDKVTRLKLPTTKSTTRITSCASKTTITRLTPIDLPLSKTTPSPKSSHHCIPEKTPTSKAELISKAKNYGRLANSRNLFKMKLQSQNKSSTFSKNFEYLKKTDFPNQEAQSDDDSDNSYEINLPFVSTRIRKRSEEAFKLMEKEEKRKNCNLLFPLINFNQNPGKRFEFRSKS